MTFARTSLGPLFALVSSLALAASGCECGGAPLPGADVGARDGGGDVGSAARDANDHDASLPDANATDANALDANGRDTGADASTACAGAFVPLGDLPGGAFSSEATAISRDGTTVVGQSVSGSGTEAMRWTAAGGMVALGDLPGGAFGSRAFDVSGDGSVVVGTSQSSLVDCPGRVDEAFRWRASTGMQALGDLAGGCYFSYAYGISVDGNTIVGGAMNGLAESAATWTEAGGWHDLGLASIAGNSSSLDAITPDGTVVVGTERVDATASYQVLRHTASGAELLGDLPGGDLFAAASAVSDDGTVLVGFGTSASGTEAFRWTSASGLVALGDLPGGAFASRADAMTPDGTLVVGSSEATGGTEAVAWDHGAPIARMADLLAARGVTVPTGWHLTQATGVTVVGTTISVVGDATNAAGDHEGWLARFCP